MAPDDGLPGWELVRRGIEELGRGVDSVAAALVAVGAPRLRRLGFQIPEWSAADPPERRLYRLIGREHADAHSGYNALIRRLVSFERALELARGKEMRAKRVARSDAKPEPAR